MTDEQLPPRIQLVRDFVNTYEPQVAKESLPTSAALSATNTVWLLKPAAAPSILSLR